MTHLHIDDFKMGLDVRKSILTAQPGSLQVLDNCVITQGGEIEKAKAWVPVYTLPAGTVGLKGTVTGAAVTGAPALTVFALGAGVNSTLTTLGNGVAVNRKYLAPGGGDTSITYIFNVQEYGPSQFFVSGSINGNTVLRNWWTGALVPAFLGFPALVFGQKLYRGGGSVLYFSGVGDPSVTDPLNPLGTGPNVVNPGAGFIDTALLSDQMYWIFDLEIFYKQVAVFGRYTTLLYALDPDPALNDLQQTLGTGTVSYSSACQFGTGDVLFLAESGVRSLRALNASLAAGVTDVGSPIDILVQAAIKASGVGANFATGIVEPTTGRYWLSLGNTFYVLNAWPSAHINAWSTITMPFNIDAFTHAGPYLFCRSGNTVYQYGGLDSATYNTNPATVVTPFHAADTPTTFKTPISIGAMVSGTWTISVGMQTDNPTLYELAATVTGDTYSMQKLPFAGNGTHIGFKLVCTDAAASRLGALQVQFQKTVET